MTHTRTAPEPLVRGPASGRLLKPFSLPTSSGASAQLTDYKQRHNLVIFLFHPGACAACSRLLSALGEHLATYTEAEAVVLGISAEPPERLSQLAAELKLPFALLSDAGEQVSRAERLAVPAIVITDRFGELWAAWEGGDQHQLPSADEIADWLLFIELQCRECEAPEWPLAEEAGAPRAERSQAG